MTFMGQNISKNVSRPGAVWFYALTIVLALFGYAGGFEPLESIPQVVRDRLRMSEASGEVIVVALDNKSLSVGEAYPWPRKHYAKLIDQVGAAGADNIAFAYDLSARTNDVNDKALAEAIEQSPANIFLQHHFSVDNNKQTANFFPVEEFAKHADLMNTNTFVEYNGDVVRAAYGVKVQGKIIPSMASVVSGNYRRSEEFYDIDYGIDIRTIPVISAIDILDGRWSPESVKGKTVVIAGTATTAFPAKMTPGNGLTPKAMINVLAAETLHRSTPVNLGILPFFLLGTAVGLVIVVSTRRKLVRLAGVAFGLSAIILPSFYEPYGLRSEIMPGIAIVLAAAAIRISNRVKDTISTSSLTDAISGMPNSAALKARNDSPVAGVAAFMMDNFADIELALKDNVGKCYAAVGKTMEIQDGQIYHGGYGIVVAVFDNLIGKRLEHSVEGMKAMLRTIHVDDHPIDTRSAFGICDDPSKTISERARCAIIASREAYDENLPYLRFADDDKKSESIDLSTRMERAIDSRETEMVFQPKVRLKNQSLIGGEMLIRWNHPTDGPMNIQDLILHAEKYDRIWDITKFSLQETARFLARIDLNFGKIILSVNLSAKLLSRPDLPDMITEIVSEYGVEPCQIMLEVTETAAISSGDMSLQVMKRLRNAGFELSIDDYGTGASTLEYLKKVPASEIKIDRSFVDAMESNKSDEIMVRSTIQLAESLDMTVIAEGIERKATMQKLIEMGCYGGQGYYFAKPMKLDAALEYISGSTPNEATG